MENEFETFTILSQNINYLLPSTEIRLNILIKNIKDKDPTFICIQDSSRQTTEFLCRELSLLKYHKFIPKNAYKQESTCLIFSKLKIEETQFINFSGQTSKGLCLGKIDIFNKLELWICSSKLNNNVTKKKREIIEIPHILKSLNNVILGCDTTITNYQKYLSHPRDWEDAWIEAGDDNNNLTMDCDKNLFCGRNIRDRCDRVWFKSDNLECTDFELFKDEESAISDHFGILVEFKILL